MPHKAVRIIEIGFFYACLAVSIGSIILSASNPTLDGPSHLYNARIAAYLMQGNGFIGTYFATNPVPVPNLTDHIIMTLLCNYMSFASVEKVMQVLCVVGFSVGFRALVKQFNKESIGLSILAIPYSFSFLYYLGFYNFLLSFPLLFVVIIFYKKKFLDGSEGPRLWHYGILLLLTLVIYFTNGLAFLYAGFILFVFEIVKLLNIRKGFEGNWKAMAIKRLLLFSVIWLPGLICFIVFFSKVVIVQPEHDVSFLERLNWLGIMRPLVVYTGNEIVYARGILGAILLGLGIAIYFRAKSKTILQLNWSDVFFITFLFTLVCYFVIPDGSSVGMMDTRLCHYLFVFLLIWIACQKSFQIMNWVIASGAVIFHFLLLFNIHVPTQVLLNTEADKMRQGGQMIEANSVVLDVDATDNWLYGHFGCYIGEDKPLLILPNYEPNDRWFGVIWKDEMPTVCLNGGKDDDIASNQDPHEKKEIDYVFIHGLYGDVLHNEDWKGLREALAKGFKPFYFSADSAVHIFISKTK
jgi:hypothetical protein